MTTIRSFLPAWIGNWKDLVSGYCGRRFGAPQANAMPVMPDDEPFDYFATQAIADFLAAEGTPASEHNATNPFASTAEILTDLCGPLRYMSGQ
ncbi:MAG TPA: hypothetical protein VN833_12890 [Candidatus Acidoferrales bacterium]|nr:hypothetical protein [Candidatus Acidoferrales bacterium]